MTALPAELVLDGHRARWVWGTLDNPQAPAEPRLGSVPAGVLIDHGDHTLLVPWVPLEALPEGSEPFTLMSLIPLTLLEQVECAICGAVGMIVEGAWLPVNEVAHG